MLAFGCSKKERMLVRSLCTRLAKRNPLLPSASNPLTILLIGSRKTFHSTAFYQFATSRRDTNKTLNLLSEAYQEKVEVEKAEQVAIPENVSEGFFLNYEKLSKSLSGDEVASALHTNEAFSLFLELLKSASTDEEVSLVQKLMEMWIRSGRLFTKSKSVKLLDMCLLFGQEKLAFDTLCNRQVYSLRPDAAHIDSLLGFYAKAAVVNKDLSQLDVAYKCFILNLYYDIPPTVDAYSLLIASGIYVADEEAIKRSMTTLNEMRSLGWKLNWAGSFSLLHHFLKNGKVGKARQVLNDVKVYNFKEMPRSAQRQYYLFQAQTELAEGSVELATESLKSAQAILVSNVDHDLPALFVSTQWTTEKELGDDIASKQLVQ